MHCSFCTWQCEWEERFTQGYELKISCFAELDTDVFDDMFLCQPPADQVFFNYFTDPHARDIGSRTLHIEKAGGVKIKHIREALQGKGHGQTKLYHTKVQICTGEDATFPTEEVFEEMRLNGDISCCNTSFAFSSLHNMEFREWSRNRGLRGDEQVTGLDGPSLEPTWMTMKDLRESLPEVENWSATHPEYVKRYVRSRALTPYGSGVVEGVPFRRQWQ